MKMSQTRIGCSGWNYAHWREVVYPSGLPESRWSAHYATRFETVELNASFYRLPTRKAAETWSRSTPEGFCFAVKASRYLTHIKRLQNVREGVALLYERIAPLAESGKLGPLLWQLPENFHRDVGRLEGALDALPTGRHAFEFRHESWFVPEVAELLRSRDAALVIGDHPERRFQTHERTASFMFVRLHVGRGKAGNYTPAQLREWAERVRTWQRDADVYIYFNDDWKGFAPKEAKRLRELIA
jgi:uncharacterized protein YecE (DUF72 family)